jgi:hypothetical protein
MQLKQRESVQARGETTQHHVLRVSASVTESDEEWQLGPECLKSRPYLLYDPRFLPQRASGETGEGLPQLFACLGEA